MYIILIKKQIKIFKIRRQIIIEVFQVQFTLSFFCLTRNTNKEQKNLPKQDYYYLFRISTSWTSCLIIQNFYVQKKFTEIEIWPFENINRIVHLVRVSKLIWNRECIMYYVTLNSIILISNNITWFFNFSLVTFDHKINKCTVGFMHFLKELRVSVAEYSRPPLLPLTVEYFLDDSFTSTMSGGPVMVLVNESHRMSRWPLAYPAYYLK